MNHDDKDDNSQEEESPEEMVNRSLAEALDNQQRCLDMYHTSTHMMHVLSRFMSDPVVVQDLEYVSEDNNTSSCPSPDSSPRSKSSENEDENKQFDSDWPRLAQHQRADHSRPFAVSLQGGGFVSPQTLGYRRRLGSWEARRQSLQRSWQSPEPTTAAARDRPDSMNGKDKQGDIEDTGRDSDRLGRGNQSRPVAHQHRHPTGAGGDFHDAHLPMLDDTKENSSNHRTSIGSQGQASSSSKQISVGCQARALEWNTDTATVSSAGCLYSQTPTGNDFIGQTARTSIDKTMTEISKAAATIQQARQMLEAFNQRTQTNNNHKSRLNGSSRASRCKSSDVDADEDIQESKGAGGDVHRENERSVAKTSSCSGSKRAGPIVVRPVVSTDNGIKTPESERAIGLGNGRTEENVECRGDSILPPPPFPRGANTIGQWSFTQIPVGHHSMYGASRHSPEAGQRNLVVAGIGGSLASNDIPTSVTERHRLDLIKSSEDNGLQIKPLVPLTNTGEDDQESNQVSKHCVSLEKLKTPKDTLAITVGIFQNALKVAIQNLKKDGNWSAVNTNSDECIDSKIDTKSLIFPKLNLPTSSSDYTQELPPGETKTDDSPGEHSRHTDVSLVSSNNDQECLEQEQRRISESTQDMTTGDKVTGSATDKGCRYDLSLDLSSTMVQNFRSSEETLNSELELGSTKQDKHEDGDDTNTGSESKNDDSEKTSRQSWSRISTKTVSLENPNHTNTSLYDGAEHLDNKIDKKNTFDSRSDVNLVENEPSSQKLLKNANINSSRRRNWDWDEAADEFDKESNPEVTASGDRSTKDEEKSGFLGWLASKLRACFGKR